MEYVAKAVIMNDGEVSRAVKRMAHEIVEGNKGTEDLVLLGIQRRGVPLARTAPRSSGPGDTVPHRLARHHLLPRRPVQARAPRRAWRRPRCRSTSRDKIVILVDDVLFTGRTVRAALDVIMDWGGPRAIRLAVLVDRGHRELPIRADFVGKNVPTSAREVIKVKVEDFDGKRGGACVGEVQEAMILQAQGRPRPRGALGRGDPRHPSTSRSRSARSSTGRCKKRADHARPDGRELLLRAEHAHAHQLRAGREAPVRATS